MPASRPAKKTAAKRPRGAEAQAAGAEAATAVAALKRLGSKKHRDGLARFGLPSERAFGVPMNEVQKLAKRLGKNNELAEALWKTGWQEARLLACYVGEPARVTPAQMDRWRRDFADWGVCDTACFVLFDRSPHAWRKVEQWAKLKDEFGKRAAFALLASLALHDKKAETERFIRLLPLIEAAATDGRNFVKKGVSWALRGIGKRGPETKAAAIVLARRLAASPEPAARWVGKDALRDLLR